jgi:hypothetical protein
VLNARNPSYKGLARPFLFTAAKAVSG